ncbi:NAD-dependent epimerase/dehydratase family protein [Pseudalkalibacillus sp. Hm43]|uniref:NAD-dependent epimerase/dehydratase family protein n=1 Tax=Pseudalkalibacillus sp. Hm43 TaxID=3450742 RepID=UPI003F43E519
MEDKACILITGANGFTGMHAYEKAKLLGLKIICTGRRRNSNIPDNEFKVCDLTDFKKTLQLIEEVKPNYILHLAGFNDALQSWNAPYECLQANFGGTLHLLEAIRRFVPRSKTVVVGSALQFSPQKGEKPPHPYGLSKTLQVQLSEYWSDLFAIDVVIAKTSNLIGPGPSNGICSKIAQKIVEAERHQHTIKIDIKNGLAQCDFVDVRDAVDAYFCILTNQNELNLYEIGSGKSITLDELVACFQAVTSGHFEITVEERRKTEPVSMEIQPLQSLGWKAAYNLVNSLQDLLAYHRAS